MGHLVPSRRHSCVGRVLDDAGEARQSRSGPREHAWKTLGASRRRSASCHGANLDASVASVHVMWVVIYIIG